MESSNPKFALYGGTNDIFFSLSQLSDMKIISATSSSTHEWNSSILLYTLLGIRFIMEGRSNACITLFDLTIVMLLKGPYFQTFIMSIHLHEHIFLIQSFTQKCVNGVKMKIVTKQQIMQIIQFLLASLPSFLYGIQK